MDAATGAMKATWVKQTSVPQYECCPVAKVPGLMTLDNLTPTQESVQNARNLRRRPSRTVRMRMPMNHSTQGQPAGLIAVLRDRNAPFADRHDAAMDLAAFDGPEPERALVSICWMLRKILISLRWLRNRLARSGSETAASIAI
jgi:hypothetical protein